MKRRADSSAGLGAYVVSRLLLFVITLIGAAVAIFIIARVLPGDPADVLLGDLSGSLSQDELGLIRAKLGLDRPLLAQFGIYCNQLWHGDLGFSWAKHQSVAQLILSSFPSSLLLVLCAQLVGIAMGLPLGIYAATHRNTAGDRLSVVGAVIWSAAPSFWTSLLLIYFVAYKLGVFPVFGAGYGAGFLSVLYHLILPTFALGTRSAGDIARMSRASILEIMNFDYVRTAQAKGLSYNRVLYKHVVRNAAIPLVTIIGMNTAIDLGAAVIIESVFARPGMGRLMADAIFARDYPVVQGCALVFAGFTAGINLLTDLSYTLIDPRVRRS